MPRAAVLSSLSAGIVVLAVLALITGSFAIPVTDAVRVLFGLPVENTTAEVLIQQIRIPRMVTAAAAGAALSVAGLQLQTLFRNPLADPFSLGVASGASLGVALSLMGTGALIGTGFVAGLGVFERFGTVAAAAAGSAAVLLLVLALFRVVKLPVTLLIIGVMVGSAITALVSLLLAWTDPQRAQEFIVWGMGSFSGTSGADLWILGGCVIAGLAIAGLAVKPLNSLLLGEAYAKSVGVRVSRLRTLVLVNASLLTGTVTAFCGPIGFIGIAAPHAARRLIGTSDHRVLMPATALTGCCAALGCSVVSMLPGQVVPINVITSLLGAPIVVVMLLRSKALQGVAA
ncbi:MAG TPA: iron ABC transporter permease [Propionibacterium sp.]|nr:iron ABC transporter permease [Propionibacterium sp.]